jgi:hypothetical protein
MGGAGLADAGRIRIERDARAGAAWASRGPIVDRYAAIVTKFFAQFSDRHPSVTGILRFMEFEHLRDPQVRALSAEFARLAEGLLQALPDDPELVVALRKLREAKDCAVGLAAVTRQSS